MKIIPIGDIQCNASEILKEQLDDYSCFYLFQRPQARDNRDIPMLLGIKKGIHSASKQAELIISETIIHHLRHQLSFLMKSLAYRNYRATRVVTLAIFKEVRQLLSHLLGVNPHTKSLPASDIKAMRIKILQRLGLNDLDLMKAGHDFDYAVVYEEDCMHYLETMFHESLETRAFDPDAIIEYVRDIEIQVVEVSEIHEFLEARAFRPTVVTTREQPVMGILSLHLIMEVGQNLSLKPFYTLKDFTETRLHTLSEAWLQTFAPVLLRGLASFYQEMESDGVKQGRDIPQVITRMNKHISQHAFRPFKTFDSNKVLMPNEVHSIKQRWATMLSLHKHPWYMRALDQEYRQALDELKSQPLKMPELRKTELLMPSEDTVIYH